MKLQLIMRTAAGVLILWAIVLGAIHFLHIFQPTSDSVAAWSQRQEWSSLSSEDRAQRVAALADQINQLSFVERQKFDQGQALRSLMQQMTGDEKLSLMDKTLPKGFAQLMDTLNRMKPEDRRQIISQALENMKKWNSQQQDNSARFNDATVQKLIQNGFSSYLQDASADTKLDLAPLIEQIQVDMQGLSN